MEKPVPPHPRRLALTGLPWALILITSFILSRAGSHLVKYPSASQGSSPLRVAFVLHSSKQDGAGKAALELLAGLRPLGVKAFVLLPSRGPLETEVRDVAEDVRIIPYRWWMDRSTPGWKKLLRSLWNLAMIAPVAIAIRKWQCNVVYSNTLTISVGGFAARLLRLPHLWHFHELWSREADFVFDLGERTSLKLVNALTDVAVVVSNTVREPFSAWIESRKLRTVYQSVQVTSSDADAESPAIKGEASALACVVSGVVYPHKRQEDALRAIGVLHRDGIEAELWLLGQSVGDYEATLRGMARDEGVSHLVRFLGFRRDPFPVLRAADVVLISSPQEGFGRVAVEAMLLGKVVVAARGGGSVELIEEGVTGLLYEPGDAADLARRIRFCLENREALHKMGESARQWSFGRFTRERYAGEVKGILEGMRRG